MGSSAFEILIVPVLWATFGGILAGAAILVLMNAVTSLVVRLGQRLQSRAEHQAARSSRPRAHRPVARRFVAR
jgi:hypothetical protein